MGEPPIVAKPSVGGEVSLAYLLFRVGRVLEPGRRRPVRIHDQSSDRAVLHAGSEHHAAARACGAVRRVRDARDWADAVFATRARPGDAVERRSGQVWVLGHEYRPARYGHAQPVARRPDADLGVGRTWLLVRPQP